MTTTYPGAQSIRLGIVMQRRPGATRWAKWAWKAARVFPGAPTANWDVLDSDAEVTNFHAATQDVWLYVSDTEAYVHELSAEEPSVYVILRDQAAETPSGLEVVHLTVSPYEAQDFCDSGEEIVEKVPMPEAVRGWVEAFVALHHVEEPFIKRRRNRERIDAQCDGVGDPRIAQTTDVYRAPTLRRREAAE